MEKRRNKGKVAFQRKGRKKVTANLGVTFFSPFPVAVLETFVVLFFTFSHVKR